MLAIKSSNLKSANYDGKSKAIVEFKNGGLYEYEGVKPEVFTEFEKTFQTDDSSGKFFMKNIRPLKFQKLKHHPECECGVCNFCDGTEDIYGNKTTAK